MRRAYLGATVTASMSLTLSLFGSGNSTSIGAKSSYHIVPVSPTFTIVKVDNDPDGIESDGMLCKCNRPLLLCRCRPDRQAGSPPWKGVRDRRIIRGDTRRGCNVGGICTVSPTDFLSISRAVNLAGSTLRDFRYNAELQCLEWHSFEVNVAKEMSISYVSHVSSFPGNGRHFLLVPWSRCNQGAGRDFRPHWTFLYSCRVDSPKNRGGAWWRGAANGLALPSLRRRTYHLGGSAAQNLILMGP